MALNADVTGLAAPTDAPSDFLLCFPPIRIACVPRRRCTFRSECRKQYRRFGENSLAPADNGNGRELSFARLSAVSMWGTRYRDAPA